MHQRGTSAEVTEIQIFNVFLDFLLQKVLPKRLPRTDEIWLAVTSEAGMDLFELDLTDQVDTLLLRPILRVRLAHDIINNWNYSLWISRLGASKYLQESSYYLWIKFFYDEFD
jgi:hypothetical protein